MKDRMARVPRVRTVKESGSTHTVTLGLVELGSLSIPNGEAAILIIETLRILAYNDKYINQAGSYHFSIRT